MSENECTVAKKDFDKIMKEETYACKNPVLLKALIDNANSFDIGLPAKAAESLGTCLQGLMKLRKEEKLSEQTLIDGIEATIKFDQTGETLYHSRDNTLRILAATWKEGEQVFTLLGGSKEMYQKFCRSINENYVKGVPVKSQKIME